LPIAPDDGKSRWSESPAEHRPNSGMFINCYEPPRSGRRMRTGALHAARSRAGYRGGGCVTTPRGVISLFLGSLKGRIISLTPITRAISRVTISRSTISRVNHSPVPSARELFPPRAIPPTNAIRAAGSRPIVTRAASFAGPDNRIAFRVFNNRAGRRSRRPIPGVRTHGGRFDPV